MRKSERNCVAFPTLALILAFTENEIRKNVKVSSIFLAGPVHNWTPVGKV